MDGDGVRASSGDGSAVFTAVDLGGGDLESAAGRSRAGVDPEPGGPEEASKETATVGDNGTCLPSYCCPSFVGLTTLTVVCGVTGFLLGFACNSEKTEGCTEDWMKVIEYPGRLWISALRLLSMPLMVTIMILTPSKDGNLGTMGRRTVTFYLLTSTLACAQGLFWVNVLRPGDGVRFVVPPSETELAEQTDLDAVLKIGYSAVPPNIVTAMTEFNILGLISFFLCFGVLLRDVDKERRTVVIQFVSAVQDCILRAILTVVRWTPLGILSAVAGAVSRSEDLGAVIEALSKYLVAQLLGQTVHVLVVYPILFYVLTGANPFPFYWRIKQSVLTAFATSSSAATLPVSLRVNEAAGVPARIGSFVLPLGAAVNLDGTSLGFPVMVMFSAQLFDQDVKFATQLVVGLLGVLASIGTAPIPNAGLVYLTVLLEAAGGALGEPEVQAQVLAMILVFDWLVDRAETATNVLSDNVATKVVEAAEQRHGIFRFFKSSSSSPVTPGSKAGGGRPAGL